MVTVLVLNAGRLADMFGRARTYTLGFAVFTLASVACAVAGDAGQLIAARVLQGVGGAFLMANSAALVADAFPRQELGRALGINAMVVGAGLILGPILGGFLTSFGWRTVFWFNVPIGVLGTVVAWRVLVEQARSSANRSIDWVGSTGIDLAPFIQALHLSVGAGVIASLAGAGVSMIAWRASIMGAGTRGRRPGPLIDPRLSMRGRRAASQSG